MKPRPQEDRDKDVEGNPSPAKGATSAKNAAGRAMTTTTGKTKKQPSATSAAGKKIARKTAHSLIERRRRSKMNEEFAVLKGLIPACTGEMHKLAILQVSHSVGFQHHSISQRIPPALPRFTNLPSITMLTCRRAASQASIEYVRYLEDCITKLKAQHARDSAVPTPTLTPEFRFAQREAYDQDGEWNKHAEDDEDEEESVAEPEDVEMTDSDAPSPTFAHAHTHVPASRSNHSSVSPTLDVAETRPHATDQRRHYSLSAAAAGTSPAVGPHGHSFQYPYPPSTASASASHSTPLTSPALQPQLEIDHEVSAALLMLNSDRRAVAAVAKSGSARGMSVRDLLSS
jgi:hypothetical protein